MASPTTEETANPMRNRLPALVLASVLAGGILAGCGGDDGEATDSSSGSEGGSQLDVIAEDIKFPKDTYSADAGTIDVKYENEGSIVHTLLVDDVDGFKLEVKTNGDVDEGSVDLETGTYTIYCDVPGHRATMEATLEVT